MSHFAATIALVVGSIGPSIHGTPIGLGPHAGSLIVGLLLVALIVVLAWSFIDG